MFPANRVKKNGKIDIWDLGPQVELKAPEAPPAPDEKLKGAELAAAQIEHEDALEQYKDDLRAWNASRKERREWAALQGGPVKLERWAVDARHAMEVEPDRYKLDLPKGMKPGKAQMEAEEQAAAEAEELRRQQALDPMHSGATQ